MENFTPRPDLVKSGIIALILQAHTASKAAGWWMDPITGLPLIPDDLPEDTNLEVREAVEALFPYVIGTKIALIHSEVSEGLEAFRTNAKDDKLPKVAGITAEMADAMIRIGDLMGCLLNHAMEREATAETFHAYSLAEAIVAKMGFNATRPDHQSGNRRKPGGKKF